MECTQNWMITAKTILRESLVTVRAPKHILPEERLTSSLHVSSSKRAVLKSGNADFCVFLA
jgi:hypothetical protein